MSLNMKQYQILLLPLPHNQLLVIMNKFEIEQTKNYNSYSFAILFRHGRDIPVHS